MRHIGLQSESKLLTTNQNTVKVQKSSVLKVLNTVLKQHTKRIDAVRFTNET